MESLEFHQFYCSILEQLTQLLLKGPFDPQIILYLVATRQEAMPLSQLFEVLFDPPVVVKETRSNAIKPVVRSFVRSPSCCQISGILNSKSQKQVCQKDRCCPSAKKKDIQLQNLPISKMNCADSTERPLKLPEPVFHCVDISDRIW